MADDSAWNSGWQKGTEAAKKSNDKSAKGSKGDGKATSPSGGGNPYSILSYIPKMHKGGKVKKTGVVLLQKGEVVIPAHKAKSSRRKGSSQKKVAVKA